MSPILGIVRVKFLSGRRTDGRGRDGRRRLFLLSSLPSFSQSLTPLAALHFKNWSTFRGQTDGTSRRQQRTNNTSESAPAKVPDFVPRKDVGIFCVLGIILTISANNGQKTEFVSKSSTGGLMDSRGG